jgi:hypothetical protein
MHTDLKRAVVSLLGGAAEFAGERELGRRTAAKESERLFAEH